MLVKAIIFEGWEKQVWKEKSIMKLDKKYLKIKIIQCFEASVDFFLNNF